MVEKRARLRSVEEVAPDVLRVDTEMVNPAAVEFCAGQFISLDVDSHKRRSYSIASPPTRTDGFELVIKKLDGGHGAQYVNRLSPGQEITFTGPMGFFTPDELHPGDVVLGATGVGIAPLWSILHAILARPDDPEAGSVTLYWGLRHERDLFWQDTLAALAADHPGFSYHPILSKPESGWTGETGYITPRVVETAKTARDPIYYLCGNGQMIADVKRGLEEAGVDRRRQVRTEVFYPAARRV